MHTRRLSTAAVRVTGVALLVMLVGIWGAKEGHSVAVVIGSRLVPPALSACCIVLGWGALLGTVGNTVLAASAILRRPATRRARALGLAGVITVGAVAAAALLAYCLGDPWVGRGPLSPPRTDGAGDTILARLQALLTVVLTAAGTGIAFLAAFSAAVAPRRRSAPGPVPKPRGES